eukprot:570454-Rhodomonas_salina.1
MGRIDHQNITQNFSPPSSSRRRRPDAPAQLPRSSRARDHLKRAGLCKPHECGPLNRPTERAVEETGAQKAAWCGDVGREA